MARRHVEPAPVAAAGDDRRGRQGTSVERRQDLGSHLVDGPRIRRTEERVDTTDARAAFHEGVEDRVDDTCRRPAPAGVDRREGAGLDVDENDRNAVGGGDREDEASLGRDEGVAEPATETTRRSDAPRLDDDRPVDLLQPRDRSPGTPRSPRVAVLPRPPRGRPERGRASRSPP